MQYTKSKSMMLALVVICAPTTAILDEQYKEGAEVIALRDVELKAGAKRLGTAHKGQKLSVEQVQDRWLWVRSGDVRGWVDRDVVMEEKLFAWYRNVPDVTTKPLEGSSSLSVNADGCARGKILGVTFQLNGLPAHEDPAICHEHPGPGTTVIGSGINVIGDMVRAKGHKGRLRENGVFLGYESLAVELEQLSSQMRALMVNGRSCGGVRKGDHVLIDGPRRVSVNGQSRPPR